MKIECPNCQQHIEIEPGPENARRSYDLKEAKALQNASATTKSLAWFLLAGGAGAALLCGAQTGNWAAALAALGGFVALALAAFLFSRLAAIHAALLRK